MERLIAVIGPTAVGKTRVSIDLAKMFSTEIISGDSMLLYKGMNIGTAKPSLDERQGIVHHMIDILEPWEPFSVVEFQTMAGKIITAVNGSGKIPILAGGTGLYVKALLEGYQFNRAAKDVPIRQDLNNLAQTRGSEYLHQRLQSVDAATAAKLHPNDVRRIVRALEIYYTNGETVSRDKKADSPAGISLIYNAVVFGLTADRSVLYDRINRRVDAMMANGLIEEVARLLTAGVSPDAQSMQGIGYKEIIAYLQRHTDRDTAIANIKQATRRFAKRQLTWYRKMPYVHWINIEAFNKYDTMLAYIYKQLAGKFLLK